VQSVNPDLSLTIKISASNSVNILINIEIVITSNQVPKTGNSAVTSSNYQNDAYYLAAFNDAKSRLSAN
jgi:hypothetical protein